MRAFWDQARLPPQTSPPPPPPPSTTTTTTTQCVLVSQVGDSLRIETPEVRHVSSKQHEKCEKGDIRDQEGEICPILL